MKVSLGARRIGGDKAFKYIYLDKIRLIELYQVYYLNGKKGYTITLKPCGKE
jgi:hypothetical protein